MKRIREKEDVYSECLEQGMFRKRYEIDVFLIKSLLDSAKEGFRRSKKIENIYEKETKNYSFLFVERYDILRKLIDAFLLFDKLEISNHQCSNAYICYKHRKLELDWETLETLRLIRNEISYKGRIVKEDIWKSNQIKFKIYIDTFIKIIQKKLNS